ncbi:hypothetical protein CICLE_v10029727mg [Citrus x clementina]|uniref:Uncharacterized protein n=4 Tax=Citrus TaxID=2706 RepID=V4SBA4_CITCL|nr:hypothetical protein CICLE_v10029727mg [Citrus x clementina]
MSAKMRLLGLALVLMILSSCLAANGRALNAETYDSRVLSEGDPNVKSGYPPSNVNNHHYIPRQDFNQYGGDAGGSSG